MTGRFRTVALAAAFAAALAAALGSGCSGENDTASGTRTPASPAGSAAPEAARPADPGPGPDALAAEGRSVYLGNCIACHNPDPHQDGALGPAIAGSPEPLIEARVMRGEYPPGYTPKRDTRNMVPMPFLEKKIPALAAYLASEG